MSTIWDEIPVEQELFLWDVANEVQSSTEKHGDLNSIHEAYAVLLEEVDEFWDLVKAQKHDYKHMRRELMQIGAMALKAAMLVEKLDGR